MAMLSGMWAGVFVLRPPQWVKPSWLRGEQIPMAPASERLSADKVLVLFFIGNFLLAAVLLAAQLGSRQ
jgi:hypothetical protein